MLTEISSLKVNTLDQAPMVPRTKIAFSSKFEYKLFQKQTTDKLNF